MKIKKFLKKFNIIDWIIIIGIILAACFAFVYISHDDNNTESTSIDSTTYSKIGQKYSEYYLEGDIITTTIIGHNATNGEKVTITGRVIWEDDDSGARPKLLVDTGDAQYYAAFYNDVKTADIYIDQLTLEKNGSTYNNTVDITISPEQINTLSQLNDGIPENTSYEITTTIATDHQDSQTYQELKNQLYENHLRISIKPTNLAIQDKLEIIRATAEDLELGSNILGQINGYTEPIIIRIYNCNNETLETIMNNYNVTNINYVT